MVISTPILYSIARPSPREIEEGKFSSDEKFEPYDMEFLNSSGSNILYNEVDILKTEDNTTHKVTNQYSTCIINQIN